MNSSAARALLRRLGHFLDTFNACFSRQAQRTAASRYLDALFNDSPRKSMQAMHGRLSDPGTYQALQHFDPDSPWVATRVWRQLRASVPTHTGILALDDTAFPNKARSRWGSSDSTAARWARSATARSRFPAPRSPTAAPGR